MFKTVSKQESYLLSILVILGLLIFTTACAPMRDSPFAEKVETNLINSNNATIAKLQTQFAQMSFDEKPLRFALIADSHGNYRDLEKTVKFINQRAVDFTIHLGERLRRIKRKKAFPATGWFGLGSSCSDVIPANNSYVALL